MLNAQIITSQTGLFGDVADNISRIASTISLAPAIVVNQDTSENTQLSSRSIHSFGDASSNHESLPLSGMKRSASTGKSNIPIDQVLIKTEKLMSLPTNYTTAISKASFFDKIIGAMQEGMDENTAMAKAARLAELVTKSADIEEDSKKPFQTSVQHLNLQLVQSELSPKANIARSKDANLDHGRKSDYDSNKRHIDRTASDIHDEVAKAHAGTVISTGLSADSKLGRLKSIVTRLEKVSSTPYAQGGMAGLHTMADFDLGDELREMRQIKQHYAKLMILVNDYDAICEGAEFGMCSEQNSVAYA